MRTVSVRLDDDLVRELDRVSKQLQTSRSAFTRQALRDALARHQVALLEHKQRQGYQRRPVAVGEFSKWEEDQVWVDE